MVTLKERVPKSLRTPISILSYVIAVIGVGISWILVTLGLTLYWDLQGLSNEVSNVEALQVTVLGLVVGFIAYLGLKGFMYFSY